MKTRMKPIVFISVCYLIIACNNSGPFTFVQMCDPQLGFGGYANDSMALVQAVHQINNLDPDFVVVCGDLVHNPGEKPYADFMTIMSGLEMPYHYAAGNHDMGSYDTETDLDSLEYYREVMGNDYFSFSYHDYDFVVVNSSLWVVPVADETEAHDAWLKQELSEIDPADKLIVVAHHQLFNDNPDEQDERAPISADKRDELLELFQGSGLVAYLHGHIHATSEKTFNGVQFVSGETTSRNFDNRPFGFRLWEATDTSLVNEFIPLE